MSNPLEPGVRAPLDEETLERLLRDDASSLEPSRNRPSAEQLWWKAQILRRWEERAAPPQSGSRGVPKLLLLTVIFFILSVNAAILSLLPEAAGPSLVVYCLVALVPLGLAASLVWALRDS